jgi:predicted dehydrogenase
MAGRISRRRFLQATAAAGAAALAAPRVLSAAGANEKLHIACIGAGGRGGVHVEAAARERLVALVDVDEKRLAQAAKRAPKAARFYDYRRMFDKMHKDIDAVVVATPDHSHAPATMLALRHGKHCYTEKPLAHSVHEVRAIVAEAGRRKVATQMGNQGHAREGCRLLCEWVWDGAVGQVGEVHAWTDRPAGSRPQGIGRPGRADVPRGLHWDLWLGPAPQRPYAPGYHPFHWRGWFDFGTGALGDMGCHVLDGAFWALKLRDPASIEVNCPGHDGDCYPARSITTYRFPARGQLAPCRLTWYDAKQKPPQEWIGKEKYPPSGSLLRGEKGSILMPHGGEPKLLPEELEEAYRRPGKTIPRSNGGHWTEFLRACKGGPAPMSSFGYAGALTEMVLLGCLAQRMNRRIEWDGANMKVTNRPEADQYLRREYRKGWTLE